MRFASLETLGVPILATGVRMSERQKGTSKMKGLFIVVILSAGLVSPAGAKTLVQEGLFEIGQAADIIPGTYDTHSNTMDLTILQELWVMA